MKRLFALAILLSTTLLSSVFAQIKYTKGSLSGIVKNTLGEPLIAASIYIIDLKIGATTNDSGFFHVDNIPQGKFLVEVQYVGYARIAAWITIDSATQKNFTLQKKIIENNEVIVTGVSKATNTRQSSVPISIMRKENLLQTVSTNINVSSTLKSLCVKVLKRFCNKSVWK